VGRALIQLEELAAALDRIGGRIGRWVFDPAAVDRPVEAIA
jgi:hypothetical protein